MARALVVLFFAFGLLANTSHAQSTNAAVGGQITDEQGRVVPSATVVLTNLNTGIPYQAKTNGDGFYNAPNLPPGIYRANVTKDGFKSLVKGDIELHVQDVVSINFQLQVGSVTETVTVSAGAPLVNTTDGAVSTVIDHNFVENMPLNGRSFNTLLQLTPGVVVAPATNVTPGQFSINGQRTNGNYFTVDGVSANFGLANASVPGQTAGGALPTVNAYGGTSALVSADALQEFRIETSSYAPEFGRQPGGQIIISTRSGANQFHGDAFDYFRNDVLDANDWFSNATIDPKTGKAIPRAPLRQNDFGGTFGGPILRDKTFFFFSYEGLRLRTPDTAQEAVPSAAARMQATGEIQPILNAFPQPNGPDLGGDTALFTGSFSNAITLNATSLRVDHRIGKGIQVFGRANYAPSSSFTRFPSFSLSTFDKTPQNTFTVTGGVTIPMGRNLINSFRANYSRFEVRTTSGVDSLGGAVPFSSAPFFPSPLSPSNSALFLDFFDVQLLLIGKQSDHTQSQLNFVDDVSLVRGRHNLKFGVDFRRELPDFGGSRSTSLYLWTGVPAAIAPGATPLLFEGSAQKEVKMSFRSYSLYAQDSWNLNSKTTLTYGLRWEVNPAPTSIDGPPLQAFLNFNNPQTLAPAPAGTPLWTTKYTNFAPRLGIAYKLTPDGRLVLRSGWGMFYDLGFGTAGNVATNPPYFASNLTFFPNLPVSDPLSGVPPFSLTPPLNPVDTFDPNLQLPYSMQWNVALEKAIGSADAVSVTYLGQVGRRLLFGEQSSQSTAEVRGKMLTTVNAGTSDYNALQVQWKHRLSHGLQVLANYTYSHSVDTASSDNTESLALTQVNLAQERGNSDFDVRQNFSSAVTFALPGGSVHGWLGQVVRGWSVDGLVEVRSSLPVNVTTQQVLIDPTVSQPTRPDLRPGVPIYLSTPSAPGGWVLNPNAFVLPSTPRQGSLGRNSIHGFGFTQMDTSLARRFRLHESLWLQFRVDAFNVLNHPNFADPIANFDSPLFGKSTSMLNNALGSAVGGFNPLFQQGGPRSLQLSLKLQF